MTSGRRANTTAVLRTPSDMAEAAVIDIAECLNQLLADCFALYIKTKNFHWHMSGPHFRDYHLMLDDQGDGILSMTDEMAERVRKLGAITLHSIGQIAQLQKLADNDADYVPPATMLTELLDDNRQIAAEMRAARGVCEKAGDVASTSLLENWIDQAEQRAWFLFEASRAP